LNHPVVLFTLIAWSLAWKGIALWKAATLRDKAWFIIILLLNTAGILEIVYLFIVAKRKQLMDRAFGHEA